MKADAWEAGHRVPFIVRWPNHVSPGTSSHQLLCFTDLLATFSELLNVELPQAAAPDSFSFLTTLLGQTPDSSLSREQFVMRAGSVATMMTIRSGNWKLITGLGSGGFTKPNRVPPGPNDPPGQLYDLAADPAEQENVYAQNPKIVARLLEELQRIESTGHRHIQAAAEE